MPACHVAREERLGRAIYTLRGKLDGATALDLRRRLEEERLPAVLLDFSQVEDFADYGVSVLAQAMNGPRSPRLTGLRQHTLRLFEYFGVAVDEHRAELDEHRTEASTDLDEAERPARKVS